MITQDFSRLLQRITLLTLLLALLAIPAQAKPQDWVESSYNFKGQQRIYIYDMDIDVAEEAGLNDIGAKNLMKDFRQRATEKLKYGTSVATIDEAQLYVKARITEYKINSWTVPEHYVTKFYDRVRTYRDKDGKEWKETFKEPYEEFVPAKTYSSSQVSIRVDVYDAKTNDVVFSRSDTRVDEYEVDRPRTYDKLVIAFWNELNKKIKNK